MNSNPFSGLLRSFGYGLVHLGYRFARVRGNYPIVRPIDPSNVEVLGDPAFQLSVNEVSKLTCLDTSRLANLWNLCQLSNPSGNILEVGSFRGGGALHLSNSCPKRKVIICDSFQGFETLHPELDQSFDGTMFKNTSVKQISTLFEPHQRNYEIINGFFPASCRDKKLPPISFVHLDVDIYKATIESLEFLEQEKILIERSLIVLDDFSRKAEGVNRAVAEFVAKTKAWKVFPLFPSQGLLIHQSWWE